MVWLTSLQKAITYMESHLTTTFSMDELARSSGFSSFHFQRTFHLLTGITVGEYVRRRRLTLAAEELQRTTYKVIDIALKYGYETPEAFTKAFRRQHGLTPMQVRKSQGKITSYYPFTIEVQLKGAEPMNYQMTKQDTFQVIGRLTTMPNNEAIPALWDELNRDGTTERLALLNNTAIKGVLGVCLPHKEGMQYMIGVAYEGDVPEGFEAIQVPQAEWAVFEVIGAMPHAMRHTWQRIYKEWLPSSQYELAHTVEFELYTDDDLKADTCYSEIWLPVK